MPIECSPEDRFRDDVVSLYESSFSEIEKVPISNLERAMACGAVLDVFRDGGRLIGFTYCFIDGDAMFFIYFATCPELRGKGNGRAILDFIRRKYRDKRIFLVTEPKDPDAPDLDVRVRRQNYYLRNGCEETGVRILSDDAWFDSMFVQGRLSEKEMKETVRRYEDIHNGRA